MYSGEQKNHTKVVSEIRTFERSFWRIYSSLRHMKSIQTVNIETKHLVSEQNILSAVQERIEICAV